MQKRTRMIALSGLLTACLLAPASAWSMRCGNYLIVKGDSKAKVLKHCGEPVDKSERYALRPGSYPKRGSGININDNEVVVGDRYYVYGRTEVKVEEWTYNFGPRKLMRRVRFADGVVEEVKSLEYGYREDDN
jgi:hypothetical protein